MIIQNKNFNLHQIAESGQCFRMNYMPQSSHEIKFNLVAYGRYLELTQMDENTVELSCTPEEFKNVWEDYFDLQYDYGNIVGKLGAGEDAFLREAAAYGKGIRILKQEPFETMISFIISQNKNIPAIKNCIEGICKKFGETKISKECGGVTYTSFPGADVLALATKEELRALKTGYRDAYIIQAAQTVAEGLLDLEELKKGSFEDAVKALKSVYGIGEKVANCIALYGLHHIEGFPVDVWIKKVLQEIYHNRFDQGLYKGYSGIVQQYMFYYIRSL